MRRRILLGIGAAGLAAGSLAVMAEPASAANGPVTISLFGDPNPNACFLHLNLGIIPPFCVV